MTALNIRPGGLGVLGTGVGILDPLVASGGSEDGGDILIEAGAGAYEWDPLDQTTATVNYTLSLRASWAAFDGLAGLYTETITISITATL